jgi:hypothetical protein
MPATLTQRQAAAAALLQIHLRSGYASARAVLPELPELGTLAVDIVGDRLCVSAAPREVAELLAAALSSGLDDLAAGMRCSALDAIEIASGDEFTAVFRLQGGHGG